MIKNSFKEDLKDKYIVNENNQKIGKVLCIYLFFSVVN